MKKNLFLFFISCFCLTSLAANEPMVNEGHSLTAKPGWLYQKVEVPSPVENAGVHMIKWGAEYKHQAIDKLYAHFNIFYAKGDGDTKEYNIIFYDWNLEAALGWAFRVWERGMIVPFASIGYTSIEQKYLSKEGSPLTGPISWFYGFYGMVGGYFEYLTESNISIALLLAIGAHINSSAELKSQDQGTNGAVTLYDHSKESVRERIFFKVKVPLVYYFDSCKIGVSFNYCHIPTKGEKSSVKMAVNQYSIDFLLGLIF